MPCLIKSSTKDSPGFISFTFNEITSPLFKKKKVKNFLNNNDKWKFGVHLQGSYERLNRFPYEKWQSFILCYDKKSKYLENIDDSKKIDISCPNFVNSFNFDKNRKFWDLCVISRNSEIKRIFYTIRLIKELISKKKDIKILIIVPDERKEKLLNLDKYFRKKDYFDEIKIKFNYEELKKIDFISSNINSFGNSPLSESTIFKFLSESKFSMINSKKEGINRSIIQGFCYGTKAIINEDLESELVGLYLNEQNTVFIDNDIKASARKIIKNVDQYEYSEKITKEFNSRFSSDISKIKLKNYFVELLKSKSLKVDGYWYLDNLGYRLCGHGNLNSFQFLFNEKIFFDWFARADSAGSKFTEEDDFYSNKFEDKPTLFLNILMKSKNS